MFKKREFLIILIILIVSFLLFKTLKSEIYESPQDGSTINDSYIRENSGANFGSSNIIRVGKILSGPEHRGLIFFNLSNISSENTIISAKIQLYVNNSLGNSNITVKVYRVSSYWNEFETNWTSLNSSTSWNTPGGDYSELLDYKTISNISGIYYNFSVTNAARGWINGSYPNYGIILISNDSTPGNYTEFSSSTAETQIHRPKIIVEYTLNAPPEIDGISTDSSPTNPKQVGQNVNFTINWTDLEGNPAKVFVCNSSNINISGCSQKTFCSVDYQNSGPSSCTYTVLASDNKTTPFYVGVCDSGSNNCTIEQSYFYMNHIPIAKVIQPNGGETINQSLGNYIIKFNVSDNDSDFLIANIYYGETPNSTTYLINSSLNLTNYCTDPDSNTKTTNNCSYSWDSTGVYGTYYLTIVLNDSYSIGNDTSDSYFYVRSIIDNTPPNITAQWLSDNDISSGETIYFYANVSDPNIQRVWVSINSTSQTNLTMTNISQIVYRVSWTAGSVGNYKFKTYANDTLGNLNDSMEWQSFTIRKPNATTQMETAPSTAMPYHLIKITGQLNASDPLRAVYAYLNTPSGFTFLSDYPQNTYLGNFNANETKTATWFLSVPITETTYTLNITYTDYYSNSWKSSNFNIAVNSSSAGGGGGSGNASVYFVTLSGYPEVEGGDNYYAEAYFSLNGIPTNPDSIKISIYDPLDNLIQGPTSMNFKQTGVYNHTYSVPSTQTAGQWKTIVNATKNNQDYIATQFWKLVNPLFDVRDITIINSSIYNMNISVVVENKGSVSSDLILSWNLTRTDTNEVLDSGGETFAVQAKEVLTKYYSPSTTYLGQVKITFLGRYSSTETAGAYKIFNTTLEGAPFCGDGICSNGESCSSCPSDCGICPAPPSGGGGGGISLKEKPDFQIINFQKTIYLTKNIEKTVYLEINNTGKTDLKNIVLELEGIDKNFYTIKPEKIDSLKPGKTQKFSIKFLIRDFIGEQDFNYIVRTEELTKKEPGKIIVLTLIDYLKKEVERLRERISDTKAKTKEVKLINELKKCEEIVNRIPSNIEKEEFIEASNNIKEADICIDDVNEKIKEKPILIIGTKYWIITWILVLVLIIILTIIAYMIYKKFKIMDFFTNFISKKPKEQKEKESIEEKKFKEKIKKIEERLGEI